MKYTNLLFGNKKVQDDLLSVEKIDCDALYEKLDIQEVGLNRLSAKLESLLDLSLRIKNENEKNNETLMAQESNFNKLDDLIEKEISIVNKLHGNINVYKSNLDDSLKNFKINKEKLLTMIGFISDVKTYIRDIELASDNVKRKSETIFGISKTIKKISDNTKLLSINAQIESAKSSIENNGFMVISNEMARMSDNTRDNSLLIDKTIGDILNDINNLNDSVKFNSKKIEESISLCSVIIDFIENLFEEQNVNIKMFNDILVSIEDIIYFIKETKTYMKEGQNLTDEVFRNTTMEYFTINSLIEESATSENELKTVLSNKKLSASNSETISVLIKKTREYDYDPLNYAFDYEMLLCRNIYRCLFKGIDSGAVVSDLAKGWSTKDNIVWTIYIKDNAKFSNGADVTAEDVEFSLLRAYNIDGTGEVHGLDIIENKNPSKSKESISGIKIINNKVIEITLKDYLNSFLNELATPALGIICKKEYVENKKVIGSGNYYIDSCDKLNESDSVLHLLANPYLSDSVYVEKIDVTLSYEFDEQLNDIDFLSIFDIVCIVPYYKFNFLSKSLSGFSFDYNDHGLVLFTINPMSNNKLMRDKDYRQFLLNKLYTMNLEIFGSNDFLTEYRGFSTYWKVNNVKIDKWLSPCASNKNYNTRELNLATYENLTAKAITEKIKSHLDENGVKTNMLIANTLNIPPNVDAVLNIINMTTSDMYSQVRSLTSAPFFLGEDSIELSNEVIAANSISNFKTKIETLKEIELKMLKKYYTLPIAYTKTFSFKKNNITSLNGKTIASLDFGGMLKSK